MYFVFFGLSVSFHFYFKNMDYFRNRVPSMFSLRPQNTHYLNAVSTVLRLFVLPSPARETSPHL